MLARLALCLAIAASPAAAAERPRADVLAIEVAGAPGAYEFRVTLRSPDQSCARYASWWEVVRPDGSLVYRRILNHSHPDEQPFTRAGGPISVSRDETLVVRAFLHPDGYGGALLRGSVRGGFKPWSDAPPDFASGLAGAAPQPERCLY
jgi:hypothetical protein